MTPRTVVVEWNPQRGALIDTLLPRARHVSIMPGEPADELLHRTLAGKVRPTRVLLHIDLTDQRRIPLGRSRFLNELRRRRITNWNGRLTDISKSTVQRMNRSLGLPDTRAPRRGPAAELVIVKTRCNHFGGPEGQLSEDQRAAWGYPRQWSNPLAGLHEYPVLSRSRVPASWWSDRTLFLERFVTNSKDEFFRVFLVGEHCVFCVGRSTATVKRPQNGQFVISYLMSRDCAADTSGRRRLPPAIWTAFRYTMRFAHAFGMEFGAIDIVRDERQIPYIIDVNPTPTGTFQLQAEVREYLRAGFRRPDPGTNGD